MDEQIIEQAKSLLPSLHTKNSTKASLESIKDLISIKPKPPLGINYSESIQALYSLLYDPLESCFKDSDEICNICLQLNNEYIL